MSIKLMMPSNHLILCRPLLPWPSIFPSMKVFSWVAQRVKNLPAMGESWVQSLGQEDPLKKGMVACSSIIAWRISWTEEPGGLQSMGSQRVRHDEWVTHTTQVPFPSPVFSTACWLFLPVCSTNTSKWLEIISVYFSETWLLLLISLFLLMLSNSSPHVRQGSP